MATPKPLLHILFRLYYHYIKKHATIGDGQVWLKACRNAGICRINF
jgi:hypothetical protein